VALASSWPGTWGPDIDSVYHVVFIFGIFHQNIYADYPIFPIPGFSFNTTEPSLAAFWEEDIIVKECRWLSKLMQDENLRGRYPIEQATLEKKWTEGDCASFVPPPKKHI